VPGGSLVSAAGSGCTASVDRGESTLEFSMWSDRGSVAVLRFVGAPIRGGDGKQKPLSSRLTSCSKSKASDMMLEDEVRPEALKLDDLVFKRPSHTCSSGNVADSGVEGCSSSKVGVEQVDDGSERAAMAAR
jgi:hypothetical protein